MAEIGIVASIIGVAGAGFRLSLLLNAVSSEVANAPLEIHHISKTVTLFAIMLKQTATVLKAADSIHSHEAVEAAQEVSAESERVFDEISEMLARVQTRKPDGTTQPSVQQRFKWCFKKNRIQYLLAQLESLKLSLSLMLQILQLAKLMAATSKSDPPEEVKVKSAAIQQERAEAQNIVIVRYRQNEEVDRLFRTFEQNGPDSPLELASSPISETSSILTIEAPPEYSSSTSLVKLPVHSLGELDQLLSQMHHSSKNMVQISNQVIDPLLEKWTRWHEVREERHTRQANGRYVPKVDNLNEDEDELPIHRKYEERADSPRGYYLEGTTTDWRRPHSVAARHEAAHRRKRYAGYQPSASAASSDGDHSPASNASSKRGTRRHIINSSSDSSDSEDNKRHRRKDSGVASHEASTIKKTPQTDRSISNPAATSPSGNGNSTAPLNGGYSQVNSRSSLSPQYVPQHRPFPNPDQQMQHHSNSTPLPPLYTHNATHQPTPQPASPNHNLPPQYGQFAQPPRQVQHYNPQYPQSRMPPPNLTQRDGRRSPRQGQDNYPSNYSRQRNEGYSDDRYRDFRPRDSRSTGGRSRDDHRHSKEQAKNLTVGAAKGLLGAGAIAGFLEALEGLSL